MVKGEVIALRRGYDGSRIREEHDVFHYEGPPGSWMKEVPRPRRKQSPQPVPADDE